MRPYSWLMAQCYDLAMRKTEQLCLSQWRSDLLAQASGTLLEIGSGTGLNLPHYPAGQQLILCEPDRYMRQQLQRKLPGDSNQKVHISNWHAEQLELPDHSVDTVVSTLVLCSVKDPQQALKETYRVLKPGGQLLFIEHVRSENRRTARWQKLSEPLWRCACGNCHLTRATVSSIEAQGMVLEELHESELSGAPAIVRRTLRGRARKPDTLAEVFVEDQDFDLSNAPPCPHCDSEDVAKMIYGKPALTRQIVEGLEAGKIISAGCLLHGAAPEWHCYTCKRDFGQRTFSPSATGDQP